MARPVPHCGFLMDLARRLQGSRTTSLARPVLLAANPVGRHAIIADAGEPDLHLYDRKQAQVVAKLASPPRWRKPVDYRHFGFSDDGLHACAYYPSDKSFAVWNLDNGSVAAQIPLEGTNPGRLVFLPGSRVAVSDGAQVLLQQIGGSVLARTKLPQEALSIILCHAFGTEQSLLAIGAFRMDTGGYQVRCHVIQGGRVVASDDGPYRAGAFNRGDRKTVRFNEIHPIPGATRRILIISEEERTEKQPEDYHSAEEDEFDTHLLGLDPTAGKFFPEEIYLSGRYCLELAGRDMHVLDERGCRRRVIPFPMRLEAIDWRIVE